MTLLEQQLAKMTPAQRKKVGKEISNQMGMPTGKRKNSNKKNSKKK